jgi:hypothetical protein
MKNQIAKIYLVLLDDEPKYVGFTSQPISERWQKHCSDANRGSPTALHNAIRKYGKDAFDVVCVAVIDDVDHALNVAEPAFIEYYRTYRGHGGYNLTLGGDGCMGWKASPEQRRANSKSHIKYPCSTEGHKICPTCVIEKPIDEFHKDISRYDGHDKKCKDCENARNRERYWRKRNENKHQ